MCTTTIERTQEENLAINFPLAADTPALYKISCAWCLSEQGIPAGEGSHGICAQHVEQLLQQWEERRARRLPHRPRQQH